jgi:hypothetical protein
MSTIETFRLVRDLWPDWKPSKATTDLWIDNLTQFSPDVSAKAVKSHRVASRWNAPQLSSVLGLATSFVASSSDQRPTTTDHAFDAQNQRAMLDLAEAWRVVKGCDPALRDRAKRWMTEEFLPPPKGPADSFAALEKQEPTHIRNSLVAALIQGCPQMAVHMLADAILKRPWERGGGVDALLSARSQ